MGRRASAERTDAGRDEGRGPSVRAKLVAAVSLAAFVAALAPAPRAEAAPPAPAPAVVATTAPSAPAALPPPPPRPAPHPCDTMAIDHAVNFGWFVPDADCPISLYGEVGFAAGGFSDAKRSGEASLRFMVENGVLFQVPGAPNVDLGPVVELGVRGDTDGPGVRYDIGALLHGRVWFASDLFTFDFTAGPTLAQADDAHFHPGLYARLGPSVLGSFGIYVSYDYVFGTRDHRVLAGVDMTYAVAAIAACVVGAGLAKASNARCF